MIVLLRQTFKQNIFFLWVASGPSYIHKTFWRKWFLLYNYRTIRRTQIFLYT